MKWSKLSGLGLLVAGAALLVVGNSIWEKRQAAREVSRPIQASQFKEDQIQENFEKEDNPFATKKCNPIVEEELAKANDYKNKRDALAADVRLKSEDGDNPFKSSTKCGSSPKLRELAKDRRQDPIFSPKPKCEDISYRDAMRMNAIAKEEFFELRNAVLKTKDCNVSGTDNPFGELTSGTNDDDPFDVAGGKGVK